jgi:cellulose synthase (UDP-forming)
MIQILRTDNPLFARGLKFAQRICYFNAMTHFLYAVPRLIFLTAPLVYLFFSRSNVPGFWAAILAYALPHLMLSNITNSRIQGQHRHSFWNEIYETVLAPYILLPTLTALINPRLGTFNVTAKGGFVEETYFDRKIATPFILLLLFNIAGLLMVIPRLTHVPGMERFFDGTHPGTVAMNALWCTFNVIILGVAITVAREEIQRREQVRIDFVMPFRMKLGDGTIVTGQTIDVSLGGVALESHDKFRFAAGEWVTLMLPMRVGDAELSATILDRKGNVMRLQFESLSLFEEEMLTTILYSRADAWVGWAGTRDRDRPLRSLYRILKLSVSGLWSTLTMGFRRKQPPPVPRPPLGSRLVPLLLCALALGAACPSTHAQAVHKLKVDVPADAETAAFTTQLSLKDLGESGLIQLHGIDNFHSVSFVLPANQIIEKATLHLVYRFSPQAEASGRLKVLLNGTAFATLQPPAGLHEAEFSQTIQVPAELLVRQNQLTFEFLGREGARCEDASTEALEAHINPSSSLQLTGQRLPLANDLRQLPLPWLDTEIMRQRSIPIVLAGTPSHLALQAAGVVASYFGMAAEYPIDRFPVSLGMIPRGDVILIAESSSAVLAGLDVGVVVAPLVAVRNNPNDPLGKVLIVTGADGDQLLLAAQAVALQWPGLQGTSTEVQGFELPAPRLADDAPRWARIEDHAPLWAANEGTTRESDGAGPVQIFLRVPPDLSYADRTNLNLHLEYRYNTAAAGAGSELLIRVNGAAVGSILLKPNRGSVTTETRVDLPLPVVNLRPFSNSISAQWAIRQPHATHCSATDMPANSGSNFTGSILGTSYLGLRGLSHWTKMPNLELFSNAGFPYTRFADLSQTTVVLPQQPSAQEIELYLTLLAHFGAQTGYPALRVAVGSDADMHAAADRDFLVIGTGQDNPAVFQAGDRMPMLIDGDQLVVRDPATVAEHLRLAWRQFMERVGDAPRRLGFEGAPAPFPTDVPSVLMEGLESPYSPNRTLIVMEFQDASAFDPFISTFLDANHSSDISGDVSVLSGAKFHSFRVEDTSYALGSRPWLTRLRVSMIHGPWFLVLGILIFSLISAARIQARFRLMSVVRLHLGEEHA